MALLEKRRNDDPSLHTSDLVQIAKDEFDIDIHKRSIERAFNRAKKKPKM
jgi:transposase